LAREVRRIELEGARVDLEPSGVALRGRSRWWSDGRQRPNYPRASGIRCHLGHED